jgi:hypothetical protein
MYSMVLTKGAARGSYIAGMRDVSPSQNVSAPVWIAEFSMYSIYNLKNSH